MKTVSLKSAEIAGTDLPDGKITTLFLIRQCLDNPGEGLTIEDFKKRLRIDDAIDQLGEGSTALQLEDADFETLKQCVQKKRWGIRHKFILEFLQQFF